MFTTHHAAMCGICHGWHFRFDVPRPAIEQQRLQFEIARGQATLRMDQQKSAAQLQLEQQKEAARMRIEREGAAAA